MGESTGEVVMQFAPKNRKDLPPLDPKVEAELNKASDDFQDLLNNCTDCVKTSGAIKLCAKHRPF